MDNAAGSPHTVPLTGTISPFGLTIAPGSSSSANVSSGQMATYGLMIGGPGFGGGNVTLSCSGAPAAATCNVPGSEIINSIPINFQATVTTTARSTAIRLLPRTNLPLAPGSVLVLVWIITGDNAGEQAQTSIDCLGFRLSGCNSDRILRRRR